MIWAVWFSAILLVLIIGIFGWALMAAAKRGDELDDELAQFHHGWRSRP